MGQNRETYFYV